MIIQKMVDYYQKLYRLQDWDISIKFSHIKNPINLAETFTDYRWKIADITFFINIKDDTTSWEKVVKHELGHIVTAGVYRYIEALKDNGKINEAEFALFEQYNEEVSGNFERMLFPAYKYRKSNKNLYKRK